MSSFNAGNPTPQMMVLGLVIQESDTVSGVARRLVDKFNVARFPGGSAYDNLPSLAKKGYVQLIAKGPPDEPTRDRYAATPKGIEHFRGWLQNTELPPIIRDALQCKLEFVGHDDVAGLCQLVREQEEIYTAAYDAARARVLREQRSRRAKNKPVDTQARLRTIQRKDEANLWGMMSKRLERLGEELEELLKDIPPGEVA
ncbi:MAG TPA: PadR family transcriptional regulator [Solirubrobacteraceae bacterium]|jgi:DNA-binding PadR family transcriptional regulator